METTSRPSGPRKAGGPHPRQTFDASIYQLRSRGRTATEVATVLKRSSPWYARFLKPWLPSDLDAHMIDVPCGHGNLLFALKELGYRNVTGADSDEGQVGIARQIGLNAQTGDAFDVLRNAGGRKLSRVFSLDFIEHIEAPAALDFCKLAHSALDSGGLLVCRTPSADGPFGASDRYNDLTHRWGMTATAAIPFFSLAGFAEVEVHDEAPVPYKLANRLRRILFKASTRLASAYLNLAGIGAPAIWTRSMWIFAKKD
jgi:SAM-dependent methyltransferase